MTTSRLTVIALVAGALTGGTLACNGVLGLDPPRLDPCADTPCLDATAPSTDGGSSDDGAPLIDSAPADAAPDQGAITGLRCGGGGAPVLGCATDNPACCLVVADASPAYTCDKAATSCAGYPITCATNNDCSGSEVCCHYESAIKCEGETVCANGSLVCDPDGSTDQCPTGWTCTGRFTDNGYTLPYYGCAQP